MSTPAPTGVASALVASCLSHLSNTPKPRANHKEAKYQACLNREFGRFKLWACGFGDSPGVYSSERAPLDEVLELSQYLRESMILLLSSFASCLLMNNFKQVGDDTTRASLQNALQEAIKNYPDIQDDLCDNGSDQCQDSALGELHDIVNSLFELAPPLNDIREKLQIPNNILPLSVTKLYENLIRDKFPDAKRDIVLRCAKGNTILHERIKYISEAASVGSCLPSKKDSGPATQPGSFHDSGIGSSRPPTSRANVRSSINPEHRGNTTASIVLPPPSSGTAVASMVSGSVNRSLIPPMPQDSRSSRGFKCYLCQNHQHPMAQAREWRRHVFADIQPYMCIEEGCSEAERSFPLRADWTSHQVSHEVSDLSGLGMKKCPFCLREFTSGLKRFYSHVGRHMEDIRLYAITPSYRQVGDLEAFENSSDSSGPDAPYGVEPLSTIIEEGDTQEVVETTFGQRLKEYNNIDKGSQVDMWFSGREAAGQGPVTDTGGPIRKGEWGGRRQDEQKGHVQEEQESIRDSHVRLGAVSAAEEDRHLTPGD